MSTATQAPLSLIYLEISNFQRIESLVIPADGNHVLITGPNRAGKSSAVDAIWCALGGKLPAEPIRHGADSASITLNLGEYVLTRHFSESGTTLSLRTKSGEKINRAAETSQSWISKLSLNPAAFLQKRPQDQVDDVLMLAGVECPVVNVREITGEDHPARPGESADNYLMRLSADETGIFYLRRREANRACDQKRKALEEQRQLLAAAGGPLKGEAEASATELLREIEARQAQSDQIRSLREDAQRAAREYESSNNRLSLRRDERATIASEIKALESQLAAKRTQLADLDQRIETGTGVVAELERAAKTASDAVPSCPDLGEKILALRRQVQEVEAKNKTRNKRQMLSEQCDRLAREVEQSQAEHLRLDRIMDQLRDVRAHLLDDRNLGIDGLMIGDGELRLRGVPFSQASQSERLDVACDLVFRQSPQLKLCRMDDAEHLDSKSRAIVRRKANHYGWQVFMTCVMDQPELDVRIMNKGEGNGDGQ